MLNSFPKTHLLAAGALSAVVGLGLIFSPSAPVEAKRTSLSLDLDSGETSRIVPLNKELTEAVETETASVPANISPVSDAQKAITFYEQLFNWRCHWINEYSLDVYCTLSENKLSTIHQIDNSIKGKYEYWTCVFGVANLQESIDKIINLNGIVIDKEKKRALCSDGSEAFFYIQEV